MPYLVNAKALLMCSMGSAPARLISPKALTRGRGVDSLNNVLDMPGAQTASFFGMCGSPANPAVLAAMAASGGVLSPMGCIPQAAGAWTPGSVGKMIDGAPALTNDSICICAFGGVISVLDSGTYETG